MSISIGIVQLSLAFRSGSATLSILGKPHPVCLGFNERKSSEVCSSCTSLRIKQPAKFIRKFGGKEKVFVSNQLQVFINLNFKKM